MAPRSRLPLMYLTVCAIAAAAPPAPSPRSLEQLFTTLKKSPPELYAFLLRMPKGADLHNHLSGAIYAESYLDTAAKAPLCIESRTLALLNAGNAGSCAEDQVSGAQLPRNNPLANELIDSLSMRAFVPGKESGHDHFFAAFDKFAAASHLDEGAEVAELARRAVDQNESYLELLALTAGGSISALGKQAELDEADFNATRQKLMGLGLEAHVTALRSRVDELEQGRMRALGCDSNPHSEACQVRVHYLFQVLREFPKEQVFAQMLAGFMLAATDPRVVGVNFVQPEDGYNSMHDYHLHMQMVAYARKLYPKVHVSLHAGELTSGLVPPEGLRFHVREAVEIAHAERIGHGVDIMFENDSLDTLKIMHERHIDVEINLTSNEGILGVAGANHPFPVYRKYGVPVTLSTDDEGVARTHLTEEYWRAALTYNLSYAEMKQLVRNSIEYSFAPPEEKTRMNNDLDKQFQSFEAWAGSRFR